MEMVGVKLVDVTKSMYVTCPIYNINAEFKDKEFTTILGPSGSGKTTILRVIAGLEEADEGEVYIGEKMVNYIPPEERDLAMVFQSYALYPHLTVFDNIASPLRAKNMSEGEIEGMVKRVAETLRISDLLQKYPTQLSGGEMQRVAIGRAIIKQPQVYLFDEPLTNLDAKLRVELRAELKRLQLDLEQTIIYTTHDEVEAMGMSDSILVLRDGRVQQMGPPLEIYNKPVNLFVASFIGKPAINLIDVSVVEEDGRTYLDAGEFKVEVTGVKDILEGGSSRGELILGVRPANTSLSREKLYKNSFKGVVYVVEPLGAETIVEVKIGGIRLTSKIRGASDFDIGDDVWISFPEDKIYIFDKKTGENLVW
jgi:multiple sugar transport system ATP-binding protein